MISKKVIETPSIWRSSTSATYGSISRHTSSKRSSLIGSPSMVIRSVTLNHVWAGESTGTKAIGSQQRFDHGGGTALAVGPGQVDDRVSPLWIAEQLGQCPDPAEAGAGRCSGHRLVSAATISA